MKKIALKTYGKIIAVILSFFGYTSCNIEPVAEYGVPSADYIVKGKVTASGTEKPIEGIGIIVPNRNNPAHGDTVYTNALGEYSIELKNDFPYGSDKMKVIAKDLDGKLNGLFEPDSIEIAFTEKDLIKKGSGNWHVGTYQKINQNFSLKTSIHKGQGVRYAPSREADENI